MRIITDLHHSVLWESLAILFLDRAILGPAELLVWRDGHHQRELGPAQEEFGRVPVVVEPEAADMVIATCPVTRTRLRSLAQRLHALYVDHIGNAWDAPIGDVVLRAARGPGPEGVVYHPEFHQVPWAPSTGQRIGSFHASFVHSPCRADWDALRDSGTEPGRAGMDDPEWVMYGTERHPLRPHEVAQARADCRVIWHCKDADGYGFGVHEAFASGRAIVGHARHYEGKLAEPLWVRGVTYLEPGDPWHDLDSIGQAARARFVELVDFDAEAMMVADYLAAKL